MADVGLVHARWKSACDCLGRDTSPHAGKGGNEVAIRSKPPEGKNIEPVLSLSQAFPFFCILYAFFFSLLLSPYGI